MNPNQIAMLDELLERESGLSAWELDFICDLDKRRDRPLTERQADKLLQIWERLCG